MKLPLTSWLRKVVGAGGVAIAAVLALAAPAAAHTPVQLDSRDVLPWQGPLILDGTDPILLFGVLPQAGAVRSAQMRMEAGQPLIATVGIPDQAPENQLATDKLPEVLLVAPDGSITVLTASVRIPLHADETDQDYLLLNIYQSTSIAGTYSIIVVGRAPSRFFVGTGIEGGPFHGLIRATVATIDELNAWYDTAP
jgi:hypothetical protein